MADKNIFKLEGKSQEQVKEAFIVTKSEILGSHNIAFLYSFPSMMDDVMWTMPQAPSGWVVNHRQ